MDVNFKRGRQVILHDPRLNHSSTNGYGPPTTELPVGAPDRIVAPKSWWTRRARPDELTSTLVKAVATRCQNAQEMHGYGAFDALHIMAHGTRDFVQIGVFNLEMRNAQCFSALAGLFRYIVFHSCLVGQPPMGSIPDLNLPTSESLLARDLSRRTNAEVIVARELQEYTVRPIGETGYFELDFGNWEGPVDMYDSGRRIRTHHSTEETPFDLEQRIFPPGRGA
ncbi:hypothetical protein J5Y09_22230 [Roseomonas sp. PWR1]|uniref:Uncharacterized protein n=1 Tax=Roseomonas nitratireducens TaxID=2820810 RepID=A0ABS4B0Q0_9PROT|nr:hypothetical protein [Neoroseomonas nitratireducens]MBP0466663.1 hypothetical protein [Neoroseomonas nitratireducens]